MYYKVSVDGIVHSKAVYSVPGVSNEQVKEVLGIYFGNSESSSFWRQFLTIFNKREKNKIMAWKVIRNNLNHYLSDRLKECYSLFNTSLFSNYNVAILNFLKIVKFIFIRDSSISQESNTCHSKKTISRR